MYSKSSDIELIFANCVIEMHISWAQKQVTPYKPHLSPKWFYNLACIPHHNHPITSPPFDLFTPNFNANAGILHASLEWHADLEEKQNRPIKVELPIRTHFTHYQAHLFRGWLVEWAKVISCRLDRLFSSNQSNHHGEFKLLSLLPFPCSPPTPIIRPLLLIASF